MKGAYRMHVRVQPMSETLAMPIDATRRARARKRPVTKLAPLAAIVLAATASPAARAAGRAGAVRFRPLRK